MKKFFYIAVCTATGIVMVSCDKESFVNPSLATGVSKEAKIEKSCSKVSDTIVQNVADPGPGDDVVIIKPPK